MHEIENYSDKGIKFFPTELKIGMLGVQESPEVAALTGFLAVLIRLIQKVCSDKMYSTERTKNRICFTVGLERFSIECRRAVKATLGELACYVNTQSCSGQLPFIPTIAVTVFHYFDCFNYSINYFNYRYHESTSHVSFMGSTT